MRSDKRLLERAYSDERIRIHLGAERPIYRVNSWATARETREAVVSGTSGRWPDKVGHVSRAPANGVILCVGPAEWLAIGCDDEAAFARVPPLSVSDVSESTATIDLRGGDGVDLLMSVCGLDLDEAEFVAGSCARTRLAGITVVLYRQSPDRFECFLPRSYASYLLAVLRESSSPRGC